MPHLHEDLHPVQRGGAGAGDGPGHSPGHQLLPPDTRGLLLLRELIWDGQTVPYVQHLVGEGGTHTHVEIQLNSWQEKPTDHVCYFGLSILSFYTHLMDYELIELIGFLFLRTHITFGRVAKSARHTQVSKYIYAVEKARSTTTYTSSCNAPLACLFMLSSHFFHTFLLRSPTTFF